MIMTNRKKASTFPSSGTGKEGRKPGTFHSPGLRSSGNFPVRNPLPSIKWGRHPAGGCPLFIGPTKKHGTPLLLILLHRGGRKRLLPLLSRRQAKEFRTVQALDSQGGLRQGETQGIAQCLHAFERILPFIRIKFVQARSQGLQPRKRFMADQGQVTTSLQR